MSRLISNVLSSDEMNLNGGGVYLLTPPNPCPTKFGAAFKAACEGGSIVFLQIRIKSSDSERPDCDAIERVFAQCTETATRHNVKIIINDDWRTAVRVGADGVHLGVKDDSIGDVDISSRPDFLIGATCHSDMRLAARAMEAGADYVAFGSFFPSSTKPGALKADVSVLSQWAASGGIPSVAIGGITQSNAGTLIRSGANCVAVCSAVWQHPGGPAKAVADLNRVIHQAVMPA